MRLTSIGLAAAVALLLPGCASFGPAEEADARKLTWFSYVNGEDLRAQCSREEPDRYRLIYNSKSNAQLRTYEVRASGGDEGAGGAVVEARIIPTEALWGRGPEEALDTGRAASMRLYLTPDQFEQLTMKLAESGVFSGPSVELRAQSGGVFWLASGCHDGTYFLTAFSNPSDRFENIGLGERAKRGN
jgi:hypothetical protein